MSGYWAIDQEKNGAIQVPATIEWQEKFHHETLLAAKISVESHPLWH